MAAVLVVPTWDNRNGAARRWNSVQRLTPTRYQREEAGMKRTCEIDGCGKPHQARGWCMTHYFRWKRHGDPEFTAFPKITLLERWLQYVDKTDGCWQWTGRTSGWSQRYPYGAFSWRAHEYVAHIVAHELFTGPVPEGQYVDHRCHNTLCVRPSHLRAVTPGQNMQNRAGAAISSRSGVRGVTEHRGKYIVWVQSNYERHYGGTFDTLAEAETAAIALRNRLHTHNDADRQEHHAHVS